MDGTDSEIMKRVVNFKKKLKNISSVKCEFVDERLTTFEARLEVKNLNIKTVDSHAAKILIARFDGLAEKTKSKEFKSELIVRESLKSL